MQEHTKLVPKLGMLRGVTRQVCGTVRHAFLPFRGSRNVRAEEAAVRTWANSGKAEWAVLSRPHSVGTFRSSLHHGDTRLQPVVRSGHRKKCGHQRHV